MVRTIEAHVYIIRNGARMGELLFVDPPSVNANSDAEIKMSLSGTFLDNEEIKWFSDELLATLTVDGEEREVGIFSVATKDDVFNETGSHYVEITAYDRCWRLKQAAYETVRLFGNGVTYSTAINTVLAFAGITLTVETKSTATLQTQRSWEVGTSALDIINELLSEINYNSIWFDAHGAAIIEPATVIDPNRISYTYRENQYSLLRPAAKSSIDAFDVPNVFIVRCENPELSYHPSATAVNDNPHSSLSTVSRGRRIPRLYAVDNVASQAELTKLAERMAYESMFQSETVEISTGVTGGHGIRDIIAIDHPAAHIDGIYEELAWSMTLAPGAEMRHTLHRMIIV